MSQTSATADDIVASARIIIVAACRTLVHVYTFTIGVLDVLWHLLAVVSGRRAWYEGRVYKERMRASGSYEEWVRHAEALEKLEGKSGAGDSDPTDRYLNRRDLSRRVGSFNEALRNPSTDPRRVMDLLRADMNRGSCGITSPELYARPTRMDPLVRDYINSVCRACRYVAASNQVKSEDKYGFFTDACRAYGNTALLLHGGVTLGMYHVGVVKALHEAELLPRIISGSNTGGIIAAFLCTSTDISRLFDPTSVSYDAFTKRPTTGNVRRKLHRLLSEGKLMDVDVLVSFLRDNLGHITFEEAYRKTGRVLNIVAQRENAGGETCVWHMNYLTAPNVLVYSACAAACAMRGLYATVELYAKAPDGSHVPYRPSSLRFTTTDVDAKDGMNMDRVRELFNVNCFVVSQASPFDIPALRLDLRKGLVFRALRVFTEECVRFLWWLHSFGLLGQYGATILRGLSTPLSGDVTIIPCQELREVLRTLSNPDEALFRDCVLTGQVRVFPHLQHLRVHLEIERTMTQCVSDALINLKCEYADGDYIPASPRAYLF